MAYHGDMPVIDVTCWLEGIIEGVDMPEVPFCIFVLASTFNITIEMRL